MSIPLPEKPLAPQEIEEVNASGPFNHSTWSGRNLTVTNEERLSGRGDLLAQTIRQEIEREFNQQQLQDMTILDVGCYDGWLLHQLSDLPFRRLIGVEPREKNIVKGETVRRLLEIPSRCEFQVGSIADADLPEADIVLCTGVLHHLDAIAPALRNLRQICRKRLIVESLCISRRWLQPGLLTELELKDVAYQFKPRVAGLTGHKYESSYYDGSAAVSGVVSIPCEQTLKMQLDAAGFSDIQTLISPNQYQQVFQSGGRDTSAICLAATVSDDPHCDETAWAQRYELELAQTILPRPLVQTLYDNLHQDRPTATWHGWIIRKYCSASHRRANTWLRLVRKISRSPGEFEILKNLRHHPQDKIALEYAKALHAANRHEEVIQLLQSVSQKVNSDWRTVYRAFFLISQSMQALGDHDEAERYHRLCLTANHLYPFDELAALSNS